MKTLLIMRHAKSSWEERDVSDYERPLNARGETDAPRMGMLLKEHGLRPDLIITSSAERALKTAELVAVGSEYDGALQVTRSLYLASPAAYYEAVAQVDSDHNTVLVVGHNPGIEAFLSRVILTWTSMTTANVGHVALDIAAWDQFHEGVAGRLVNFWQPKSSLE